MLALCRHHHDKADAGSFTKDQLRRFKKHSSDNRVKGQFDWLRNRMLLKVGGNYFYETLIAVMVRENPIIWFERDRHKHLLLNVLLPQRPEMPRGAIRNNWWYDQGAASDIICPPGGRTVKVRYENGDKFDVEFREFENVDGLIAKQPDLEHFFEEPDVPEIVRSQLPKSFRERIEFPLTVVEVGLKVAGTNLVFTPNSFAGTGIKKSLFLDCKAGISLGRKQGS